MVVILLHLGRVAAIPETVAELLVARADDDHPGLLFEDRAWSWREVVAESARRASLAVALRRPGPLHVGVLLENGPEYLFWLGAAALSGVVGATFATRPKFSASAFLPDVRRFGATFFNYVGKSLAYILATPERPDDGHNPLERGFGTEASERDIAEFQRRFGCRIVEGYGMSEGGTAINRVPDMPPGSLGIPQNDATVVLDPATAAECPPARFDEHGRLLNAGAIGEIVNKEGAAGFEGYYNNPEADAQRLRNGWYWTGDLGYRDEAGFFYFAGRSSGWLRFDSQSFAAAPVERILFRHPDVVMAAVYAVPDAHGGDQVMAALEVREDARFDPDDFARFLAQQPDLGTKWAPRFVRIVGQMPLTGTNK